MNTFLNALKNETNFTYTQNGGLTHKSTMSKNLDLFALGGSYRERSNTDIIILFKRAFEEDSNLAIKNLFYLRDILEGQGERRFFRVAFRWLCDNHTNVAKRNLENISAFGRWDDLIYTTDGTKLQIEAMRIIKHQLALDIQCKTPSLLAKWLPSQNASNEETKRLGKKIANYLGMTAKQYRKTLSELRKKINVVERLMSQNRWDEIEFDKIPSKAGLIYKNAFARRDIISKKYEAFMKDNNTTVNAKALYPYDVCHMAFKNMRLPYDNPNRLAVQKYWDNLRDFYKGREENAIAVVDVSGSMTCPNDRPLEAAISLGAYVADKSHGPFANHFITFSANPELIKFEGIDIVDKFNRCNRSNWGMNTNIEKVFNLLLNTAKNRRVKPEDMPERLYIFSDMQFDEGIGIHSIGEVNTLLEIIQKKWDILGYKLPDVIFWNLNASSDIIPAIGKGFSYVSGCSPTLIETILSGKDGYDLMIAKLIESGRYDNVH